eukprot:COSAG01_NODE_3402_length_6135_cov_21.923956_11_plen_66_part_00
MAAAASPAVVPVPVQCAEAAVSGRRRGALRQPREVRVCPPLAVPEPHTWATHPRRRPRTRHTGTA